MMSNTATKILDNLYLGGYDDVENCTEIDLIINVAKECIYKNNVNQIYYPFLDSVEQNIINHLDKICEQIDEYIKKDKTVLIHCLAGKSRSASVVLAYLIKKQGFVLEDAMKFVKSKREIYPNLNFIDQLMEYEIRETKKSTLNYDNYMIEYIADQFGGPKICTLEEVKIMYYNEDKNVGKIMAKLFSVVKNKNLFI